MCAEYEYALIVTANRNMAYCIMQQAVNMGIHIPMPITFEEFVKKRWCGRYIQAFLFDNLDICLSNVARGISIRAVSMERGKGEK